MMLRTVEQRMIAFLIVITLAMLGFMFLINPMATAVAVGVLVVLGAALLWIVMGE